MSEKQTSHNGELAIPVLSLVGGADYLDTHELHALITGKLEELGVEPATVLLCGYNGSSDERESQASVFAMTIPEIDQNLDDGLEKTPYKYAEEAFESGDKPVVTAYSRDCFTSDYPFEYALRPGVTLLDATLLTTELSAQ